MNRARELKNARARRNKAVSDASLKRLEYEASLKLVDLERETLEELYEAPDTLTTINAIMRGYRSALAGLGRAK